MFKKLKSLFAKTENIAKEKELATARGEPFVRVVEVQLDKTNPGDGYFELEWNNLFVRRLMEAGYSGATEEEIVDQWFTALCRNIADSDNV